MNHWQRIEAAIAGQPTDRTPISLWRHFPVDDQDPAKLARHMVEWQRKWDFDLVKFMPSGTFGVEDWGAVSAYQGLKNGARAILKNGVNSPDEWTKLPKLDVTRGVYGAQNAALREAAPQFAGVPILQTIFSPLTTARKLGGEAAYAHMRTHPAELERGLRTITDVTIAFALKAIEAGAHGVFLATQSASYRLMSDAEFDRFGRKYDLEIFAALAGRAKLNMLHIHGEDVMFEKLAAYPIEMVNWHDRLTPPTLGGARKHFAKALVGGVNEFGTLLDGTPETIAAEVREARAQVNGRGLIVGPGCVLPIAASDAHLKAVVDAARS